MKSNLNPLFLDSTKPVGDKIVTNVEVFDLTLQEGDSLFMEVKNSQGLMQVFPLTLRTTKKNKKFTGEVWSQLESSFEYRFFISNMQFEQVTTQWETHILNMTDSNSISHIWNPNNLTQANLQKEKPIKANKEPSAKRKAVKQAVEIKQPKNKQPILAQSNIFGELKNLIDELK